MIGIGYMLFMNLLKAITMILFLHEPFYSKYLKYSNFRVVISYRGFYICIVKHSKL